MQKTLLQISRMLRSLLQLIFPSSCPGCNGALVRNEGAVCIECQLEMEETGFHRQAADNELFYRLAGKVPLEGAFALYYFDKKGRFKRIIQGLKYKNLPQVGRYLGELYGEQLAADGWKDKLDAIIPVPLHRSRMASRGYNQSEMIALGLEKALGVKMDKKSLRRKEKTATQTRKNKTERWENVREVFEMHKPLAGNLLLVDDVITTGSTLEACIRTLYAQEVPPERVWVAALGMARH